MNLSRMIRGLVLAALISGLVYAALLAFSDAAEVIAALRAFELPTILVVLALSTTGFVVRSVRWGLLMRMAGHPVAFTDAVYLQMSGLTMSVSPGRVGEALKAWLAKNLSGMPMSTGIALVFAERVADLAGVLLLSLGGLSLAGIGLWGIPAIIGALLLGSAVAGSSRFHGIVLRVASRVKWASMHRDALEAMSATIRVSLRWRTLVWSAAMSATSWGLEGIAFALSLRALGFDDVSVAALVSVFAVSTILGVLTLLPGGIGLTEASLVGILMTLGVDAASASAATLVIRVATLWWGIVLGWMVLASRPRTFGQLMFAPVE
jgi:glycosyltransferase 2 family protein